MSTISMEMSSAEEPDSDSSQTVSNEASGTASLKTSESDSFEVIASSGINEDVEKTAFADTHLSLENLNNSDSEVTEHKTSATTPGKPKAREIGCSSILLEWTKSMERDISYYEIRFKTKTDTTWRRPVFTDFDKPCHQLRGLDPDTEYEFKVRAHYEDKEGDFSEMSDPFKTKSQVVENLPSNEDQLRRKPGKPTALDVKEDHVQLGWDKPKDKNVKLYEIKFKSSKDVNWSRPVLTENANTFYRIGELQPATGYHFKVKSHYQSFDGIYSEVSDVIKTQILEHGNVPYDTASSSQPGKPVALEVGCDYACIAWDKPDKSDLKYYEVKSKITGDECWFKMPLFTRDNTPYRRVADLMPETEYEFKVRGHYQEDEGQFSEKSDPVMTKQSSMFKDGSSNTATSKVPSRKPGKPCSLTVGGDFTDLRWDAPEDRNVSYYELKSKSAGRQAWDKMPVFTDDDKTFLRLTQLSPTTSYVFKVRGIFGEEDGEFSDVSDIITTSSLLSGEDHHATKHQPNCPEHQVNVNIPTTDLSLHRTSKHTYASEYDTKDIGPGDMFPGHYSKHRTQKTPDRNKHDGIPGKVNASHGSADNLVAAPYSGMYEDKQDKSLPPSRQPSRPYYTDLKSDSVYLSWDYPGSEDVLYYEVRYKQAQNQAWCKDPVSTKDATTNIIIKGLLQDTNYTFKVRAHYKTGDEGLFSGISDSVRTKPSPALTIRTTCIKLQDGNPAFYKLPLTENVKARNHKDKTRKCEFGSSNFLLEKTIMMIGATGSGKSTLIDGMVNHLFGVKWEDDFRFKIIDLMEEEEARKGIETESQTDWITSYRVHPSNGYVEFVLTIIDTPGFGDTRGIERDHELVEQIRAFFSTTGSQGIETIDAVCFVTQAPLARLTHTQKYIFDAILSIFGKNMENNIITMITFADGKDPPVLNALAQAGVPKTMHFVFNNSALFEPNTEGKANRFAKMFWEMGSLSYGGFFHFLPHMETQSLQLTTEVLDKRNQLKATVDGLIPQIDIGLQELSTMKAERDLVHKYAREVEDNKNFKYTADEYHQEMIPLDPGKYVTNCTFCHSTCHYPCRISEDSKKNRCAAMKDGCCTVCIMNCEWDSHRNDNFRIKVTMVKVLKTYEEMKKKFEVAAKEKVSKENLLQRIKKKCLKMRDNVCSLITNVRECGNFLRKNALKSNPLTEVEYLELLINSAKENREPGFEERIKMLQGFKRIAELKAKAIKFDNEELLKQLGFDDL